MRRPDWTYGLRYRWWSRLLHRFDLHHTRRAGPMEDGTTLIRCDWCGLSRREAPMWVTEQRMREAHAATASTRTGPES